MLWSSSIAVFEKGCKIKKNRKLLKKITIILFFFFHCKKVCLCKGLPANRYTPSSV